MSSVRAALLGITALLGCASCSFNIGCGLCTPDIHGSGVLVTKTYDYRDFTALYVGSVFRVEVVRDDNWGVEVTVDDNLVQYLQVERRGAAVQIGLGNVGVSDATLKARVSMPALERLDASGVTHVELKGFQGGSSLTLGVTGVSKVTGAVEAGEVTISCNGASHVELQGSARTLHLDVNGASGVELGSFTASEGRVNVNGCSKAAVDVRDRLDFWVNGVSHLTYAGSPALGAQSVAGCSDAKPR